MKELVGRVRRKRMVSDITPLQQAIKNIEGKYD
jgi:hypothetical protein